MCCHQCSSQRLSIRWTGLLTLSLQIRHLISARGHHGSIEAKHSTTFSSFKEELGHARSAPLYDAWLARVLCRFPAAIAPFWTGRSPSHGSRLLARTTTNFELLTISCPNSNNLALPLPAAKYIRSDQSATKLAKQAKPNNPGKLPLQQLLGILLAAASVCPNCNHLALPLLRSCSHKKLLRKQHISCFAHNAQL